MTLTRTAKFLLTVALFAVAVVIVGLASVTKSATPLFFAWIPLLTVALWVLTRPEGPASDATPEEREEPPPPGPEAGDSS